MNKNTSVIEVFFYACIPLYAPIAGHKTYLCGNRMKQAIRYTTLFLLLFFAVQRAGAGNLLPVPGSGKDIPQQAQLTSTANGQQHNDHLLLADHGLLTTLCEHASSASQASKRPQAGHDLFVAFAAQDGRAERALLSYERKYPDRHTRYFAILFPHHFFW